MIVILKKNIVKLVALICKAFIKFFDDQCLIISNGLAYKTIFALIPISAVFIGVFTMFPSFSEYKEKFMELIFRYFVPSSVNSVVSNFEKFVEQSGTISLIGTIILIYLSLDLFISVDMQVNRIWSSRIKRSLIQKVLIYWTLLTITPIVLAGYFYYSVLIRSLLTPIANFQNMDELYYSMFSFILLTGFFFFLYYIIPTSKIHIGKAFIISCIVSILWNILRFIFTYYTRIAILNWKIYGTVATLIFFLVWIFINWTVLFFGVEILQVWQEKLYVMDVRFKKLFLFDVAFFILILKELYYDFIDRGDGITIEILANKLKYNSNDIKEVFKLFEEEGLIVGDSNSNRHFYLRKNINLIKLKQIEEIIWKRLSGINYGATPDLEEICERLGNYYFNRNRNNPITINQIIFE